MIYKSIWALSILFIFNSCNSSKDLGSGGKSGINIVLGIVENIENGKDGYTAKIKSKNEDIFFALISIPNIGNVDGYKDFKVNDKVAVKGEFWLMGGENRITVRKILSVDNDNFEIKGKVESIKNGIDGYTAKVVGEEGEEYYTTISIPNLGENYEKFKEYKVGDIIKVAGELWQLGDQLRVTVRNIII